MFAGFLAITKFIMGNKEYVDNQLYHNPFPKTLILAPHPDDEINLTANLINIITQNGGDVIVAFSSNGDWSESACIRIKEARESLRILGIRSENIIFLGYGDTWFSCKPNHFFYLDEGKSESRAGHSQTYAYEGFADFSFQTRGRHSLYNKKEFCKDLYDLIVQVHPEIIICVDYDEHPDHRVLSLCFEHVMGCILKEHQDYRPEVYKRLAYPLAYCAKRDYRLNNASTRLPEVGEIERYNGAVIGLNGLQWKDRIRFPISYNAVTSNFHTNIIAKALRCHKSQYIYGRVGRILNGDEVYWERRTDNCAFEAKVEATSGNPVYVNDFQLLNAVDIFAVPPIFNNYFWQPDSHDNEKAIKFTWECQAQAISLIRLYGNCTGTGRIERLSIQLDDGYYQEIGPFPTNGTPIEISLGITHYVKTCILKVLDYTGEEYGLAECEFYTHENHNSFIMPFCKMMINNDFIYHYYIPLKTQRIDLELYCFGIDRNKIVLNVKNGLSVFENNSLIINRKDRHIVLRCEDTCGTVYDQVVITRTKCFALLDHYQSFKVAWIELSVEFKKNIDRLMNFIKNFGVKAAIKKIILKYKNA